MAHVASLPLPAPPDEELELKFTIDDPDLADAWFDEHYPDPAGWRKLRIVDRYFDTADGALSAAGYGARLRRADGKTVLTVKADMEVVDGRHHRLELQAPATQKLDVAEWIPSAARDRVADLVGGRRLIDLVVVRQKRRERLISVEGAGGGAQVMVSIDRGRVFAAGTEIGQLNQLEVELVGGNPSAIDGVAQQIDEAGIGRAESRSKLALALELAAAASGVRIDDAFAEAGRKVLRRHLVRMLSREPGVRASDVLETKQMRVATRRLRATWRVFDDAFKGRVARRHERELRTLGRAIGAVRDLDVLLASVDAEAALQPLAEEWRLQRSVAHAELVALLDSTRYARLVDEMLEFTASAGKGVRRPIGSLPVSEAMPAALSEAVANVRATSVADPGSGAADAAWHARRIEARRLRYSVEAFLDVMDPERSRALLISITALQDRLGALQDAAVAIERVDAWAAARDGRLSDEAAAVLDAFRGRRHAEMATARIGLDEAWAAVMSTAEALTAA